MEERVKLRKQLGLLEGVAIILGIIFGSGIFISPKEVLQNTGSVWGSLIVWTACGGLATLGALSYAELGTSLAQSGGDYHYINEAYGSLAAFLYLWDAVYVFVPTTNAIMSLTFAKNLLQPMLPNCVLNEAAVKLVAAVTICFITFINGYNVRFTTRLQNVFMFTKIAALFVIIVSGIVWMTKSGGLDHFHNGWESPPNMADNSLSQWSIAFYSGIFSYSGWNYLNFMTEELQEPNKNLPRAIYISLPLVTFIYVLANVAYIAVLGRDGVLASDAIAVELADHTLGWFAWCMPPLVAVATIGGLSVHIMATSRMCFVGARNRHMPELLSNINVKYMTPLPALIYLMILSLIMLMPADIGTLITYCTYVESIFTTLSCSAVLWLRYKRPEMARPIRVPLVIPIVFVAACVCLLVAPVFSKPVEVLMGFVITLTGLPYYYCVVARQPPRWINRIGSKVTRGCQLLLYTTPEEKDNA